MTLCKSVSVRDNKLAEIEMHVLTRKWRNYMIHKTRSCGDLFTIAPLGVGLKVHFVLDLGEDFPTVLYVATVLFPTTMNLANCVLFDRMSCIILRQGGTG